MILIIAGDLLTSQEETDNQLFGEFSQNFLIHSLFEVLKERIEEYVENSKDVALGLF